MINIVLVAIVIAVAFGARSLLSQSVDSSGSKTKASSQGKTQSSNSGFAFLKRTLLLIAVVVIILFLIRTVPVAAVLRFVLYAAILSAPFWVVNRVISQRAFSANYQDYASNAYREQTRTRPRTKPNYKTPYEILNISPSASKEEITKAYRKMAKMYHPDRVAELAPEFRALAEERMKVINGAYEKLTRNS